MLEGWQSLDDKGSQFLVSFWQLLQRRIVPFPRTTDLRQPPKTQRVSSSSQAFSLFLSKWLIGKSELM